MLLSDAQIYEFEENGFIVFKRYVPLNIVSALKDEIHPTSFNDPDADYGPLRKDKRFSSLRELTPLLREFFTEYISPISREILDSDTTLVDVQYSVIEKGRLSSHGWHIDGAWIVNDSNSIAGIPFFKLLVGVYLTDLTKPNSGNFVVSPGGHKVVADYFKQVGKSLNRDPRGIFEELYRQEVPSLETIFAEPGDIVMAHALLPHTIAANEKEERPVIYFRTGHYENSGYSALSDTWSEWPERLQKITN